LISTGVTWSDRTEAAIQRDEVAARNIEDVMFVSELHAAGALAQAVGGAVGYERSALMFIESDTATLSVVKSADGSIVKVQSQSLHSADAVAELIAMVAGLEELEPQPQGLFLVGSGANVGAIKPQIEMATSLPVSAPTSPSSPSPGVRRWRLRTLRGSKRRRSDWGSRRTQTGPRRASSIPSWTPTSPRSPGPATRGIRLRSRTAPHRTTTTAATRSSTPSWQAWRGASRSYWSAAR
jgi:hypothetical protein